MPLTGSLLSMIKPFPKRDKIAVQHSSDTDVRQRMKELGLSRLSEEIQQCSDPGQKYVLAQICAELREAPLTGIPDISTAPCAESQARWMIALKQQKLSSLEREIHGYLRQGSDGDASRTALQYVRAEQRQCALEEVRSKVVDNPLLQICLDEHIAAQNKQKECAKTEFFLAHLPEILLALKAELAENKLKLTHSNRLLQENSAKRCSNIITEAIGKNTHLRNDKHAEIVRLEADWGVQVDLYNDVIANGCEIEKNIERLEKLSAVLEEGNWVFEQSESLPEILQKRLEELQEHKKKNQTVIVHAEQEFQLVEDGLKASRERFTQLQKEQIAFNDLDSPLQQEKIQSLKQAESDERTKLEAIEKLCAEKNIVSDLQIRIKRLFGRGQGQHTRAENNIIKQQHSERAQQFNQQALQLQQALIQQKQQLSDKTGSQQEALQQHEAACKKSMASLDSLRKKLNLDEQTLQAELVAQIDEIKSTLKANLDSDTRQQEELYYRAREKCEQRTCSLVMEIKTLDKENQQLRQLLVNPLKNYPAYHKQFSQTEPDGLMLCIKEWQNLILREENEIKVLSKNFNDLVFYTNEIYILNQFNNEPDGKKIDLILSVLPQFDIHNVFHGDARQSLSYEASLFAILCRDKFLAHPLGGLVKKAEAAAPQSLAMLDSLENLTQGKSYAAIADIGKYLQGLRRIVTHDHRDSLTMSMYFTQQYYQPEINLWNDQQLKYGTCVLHSWNNVVAGVTGNQQMLMTPFRIEKLVQAQTTLAAAQQLGELLKDVDKLTPQIVQHTLAQIVRDSGLVHPYLIDEFLKYGHMMDHEGPSSERGSHLNQMTSRFFELCSLNVERLDRQAYFPDLSRDKVAMLLSEMHEKNYDAITVGLVRPERSGHSVVLLKNDKGYFFIDSNYNAPISLTLSQFVNFFIVGDANEPGVNEIFRERGYEKYYETVFHHGLYKNGLNYAD